MCDRLHLAQVTRASVDDAGVSSTPPGEGCNRGPPGKRAKLGARDDPQPVVGRALVGLRLVYEIHAQKILQYLKLCFRFMPLPTWLRLRGQQLRFPES